MADPRIKYDVLANAQGEEDVLRLADALDKVDKAIDPAAADRAGKLAQQLRELGRQREALDTFTRLKRDTEQARVELDLAQAAAQKLGRELANTATPTRTQTGQLEKLRDAVKAAKTELQSKVQQLGTARTALGQLGIATDQLASAEVRVRTATAATRNEAAQLATAYKATAAAATASGTAQVRAQTQVQSAVEGLNATYRRLQNVAALALGGGIFGSLARDVSQTADEFKNLQARIQLVTGEGAAFDEAFQGVAEIANRTNTRLETTGTLFARIATAGKDIGVSQREALRLTETINQSIQVSGGSAQAADAAITQLIQGLQSGVLRGEEFNSVVEQSPRLAQALADGLGVARGELRKLANDGQLTADVVIKALQSQADAVSTEFSKLPPTVGRAITTLSNNWTLYVGEVDKANGISEKAAEIILALANNLDTLGTILEVAGKAAAAFKAVQLAQTFLGIGTAAKTATAAVAGFAAAQQGAAAGAAGAAGAVSRLAAVASTLKLAIPLTVLANYQDLGTWIGEAAAKAMGYGEIIEENERRMREEAETARANAEEQAKVAAALKAAAEASLGLTKQSKALVAEFDQLRGKGESVSDALAKIGKNLDLGNIDGITDAITALDALAKRGAITGDQLRKTVGAALKDLDLGTFKTQAMAAFDGTEQGARRLQAALDAVREESLRRMGTSIDELRSGFSRAFTSAVNDLDEVAAALEDVGADAATTGRVLGEALNKASAAADTEAAIKELIARLQALGSAGKISTEQLTNGLEAARKKLDELKPGVDSLTEAYRIFGLKTKAELQAVADRNREAWLQIKNDATSSIETKRQAFKQYAESAIAANGGVADSNLRTEAAALKVEIQVDKTGKATVGAMNAATKAVQETAKSFNELGQEINEYGNVVNQLAGNIGGKVGGVRSGSDRNNLLAPGIQSDFGPDAYGPDGLRAGGGFQVDVPEGYYFTLDPYDPNVERPAGYDSRGQPVPGYLARKPGYRPSGGSGSSSTVGTFGGFAGSPAQRAGQPNPNVTTRTVEVKLSVNGGASIPVTTSESNADLLVRELELARGAGG